MEISSGLEALRSVIASEQLPPSKEDVKQPALLLHGVDLSILQEHTGPASTILDRFSMATEHTTSLPTTMQAPSRPYSPWVVEVYLLTQLAGWHRG